MTTTSKRASGKEIFGFAMFDFANSAYTTIIITVAYATLFPRFIVGPDAGSAAGAEEYTFGNLLWGLAQAVSYLLVVVTAPVLGAITDYAAAKKKLLFYSYILTVAATMGLFFVEPGAYVLAAVLIIVSNFGFASGENFVASLLPDLGGPEDQGKISGYAWGLGYIGGLISTAIVMFGLGEQSLDNWANMKLIGPVTGLFFLVAGIPTFLWVKQRAQPKALPPGQSYTGIGYARLKETIRKAKDFKDIMNFLWVIFFSQSGLSIVISFAFIYGDQIINWSAGTKTLMFILTQLTAAAGALIFGILQDRFGAKRMFNATLVLWVLAVLWIFGVNWVTQLINSATGGGLAPETVFLFAGCLAGVCLGATQSSARALVGIFSPESKSGEFFGLWGIAYKLAMAFGLIAVGILQVLFGLQNAILVCVIFFGAALFMNGRVDEQRGKQAAANYTE